MADAPFDNLSDETDPQGIAAMVGRVLSDGDNAFRRLGLELQEIRPGYAVVSMEITENTLNAARMAHGGFMFTLADCCGALAGCSRGTQNVVQQASANFLRAGKLGDTLTATAEEVSRGGRSGIYDTTVRNQDGDILLIVRGLMRDIGQVIEEK